ncbi:MAG: Phytochrome-like protein cph2 [Pseudidiomarina mangrovi]|nr:MAG: Phytochrome-like protein cph2 [Pseudidiomarina mangrovi]
MMQRDFLYAQQTSRYGWNVYVLTSPEQMTNGFITNMLVLMTSLVSVSLLFTVVARHFSRQITQPLEALSNQMLHDLDSYVEPNDQNMSEEVRLIATQLSQARNVMVEFNQQLKQQVTQKTIELERLNQQLEILAKTDGLTQLLNRRSFDEQALAAYESCAKQHKSVTMLLMDIDHFKEINDSRGHPVGDQCIIAVAELLQKQFADSQHLVARYGGEEFALLVCMPEDELQQRLTEFRHSLAEAVQVGGETVPMTVSIGAVTVTKHHQINYTQLVQRVDELLYQSKRHGRDQISSIRV